VPVKTPEGKKDMVEIGRNREAIAFAIVCQNTPKKEGDWEKRVVVQMQDLQFDRAGGKMGRSN